MILTVQAVQRLDVYPVPGASLFFGLTRGRCCQKIPGPYDALPRHLPGVTPSASRGTRRRHMGSPRLLRVGLRAGLLGSAQPVVAATGPLSPGCAAGATQRLRRWVLLCSACTLTLLALGSDAFAYTFTTVDVPRATETEAYDINGQGQIVGSYWRCFVAGGEPHCTRRHGYLAVP